VPRYTEQSFSADVIARFGHLSEYLAEDADLLHVQMSWLADICQRMPDHALSVLLFLEHTLRRNDAISEIENAVAISFLQWPDLEALGRTVAVPPLVCAIVKNQWDAFGCNA